MKLGEVIKKRDYYRGCLIETTSLIKQASTADDKYTDSDNRDRIKKLLSMFSEYYDSYQRYNLLYSRAEVNAVIPLEDGSEISVRDALTIKDAMFLRYECFKSILDMLMNSKNKSVCIDMDFISEMLLKYHEEVLSIETKVTKALWEVEV